LKTKLTGPFQVPVLSYIINLHSHHVGTLEQRIFLSSGMILTVCYNEFHKNRPISVTI